MSHRDVKTNSLEELTGWIERFQRGIPVHIPTHCSWCGEALLRKDPAAILPTLCPKCDRPEDRPRVGVGR